MHISGPPLPILQIDWPLWLCDCCVIQWLVRSVEVIQALWSLSAKDNLEINRLCNGRCQQDSKNAQPDRAPQAVADNCGMIWFAPVRLPACAACILLWFIGSKQPFQRRDCKHQQEDGIAHQPQLVKGPVRDSA